jgi:hypothetical protein
MKSTLRTLGVKQSGEVSDYSCPCLHVIFGNDIIDVDKILPATMMRICPSQMYSLLSRSTISDA